MSTPLPTPPRPPRPASVEPGADAGAGAIDPAAPVARPRPAAAPRRRAEAVSAYRNLARARVVALGGLIAMIAAVASIVLSSTAGRPAPSLDPLAARVGAPHARYWTVRPGQTLSSIATRERTNAVALEHLNPHVIPGALVSGQRVLLPG